MAKAEPGKVVVVDRIPQCDFCQKDGQYDFRTQMGPWAHGCYEHWQVYQLDNGLGVGKAQLWILAEDDE